MMRLSRPFLSLTLAALLSSNLASQAALLVNTRLHQSERINLDETFRLDLQDFFQMYGEPGPVATFSLRIPVEDGIKSLFVGLDSNGNPIDTTPLNLMSYKLSSGQSYSHYFSVHPADLIWEDHTVQFQLLPEEAPISVANFITYVRDDAYTNTVVHRTTADLGILQAGALTLFPTDEFKFSLTETRDPIRLEQTIPNGAGTLAMARQTAINTATSQFFINVQDNSNTLARNYAVFGTLINPETALPLLQVMENPFIYNLGGTFGGQAPLSSTPLYTPFYLDKESYVRFPQITVPEGDPAGITYSWAWGDFDGIPGFSDVEAANQAVFNVSLEGSDLVVTRTDSGQAILEVTATNGDQTSTFNIQVIGYNEEALNVFDVSALDQGGKLTSIWFGEMNAENYPEILHDNHGQIWAHPLNRFDPKTGLGFEEFYFYDHKLNSWVYTSSMRYPILYIYAIGKWVTYVQGTGGEADNPRWFWDYSEADWYFE